MQDRQNISILCSCFSKSMLLFFFQNNKQKLEDVGTCRDVPFSTVEEAEPIFMPFSWFSSLCSLVVHYDTRLLFFFLTPKQFCLNLPHFLKILHKGR